MTPDAPSIYKSIIPFTGAPKSLKNWQMPLANNLGEWYRTMFTQPQVTLEECSPLGNILLCDFYKDVEHGNLLQLCLTANEARFWIRKKPGSSPQSLYYRWVSVNIDSGEEHS